MAAIEVDVRGFGMEDFETASIRSAAPSYVSETPSYHTTVSNGESIPPYSPPANSNNNNQAAASSAPGSLGNTARPGSTSGPGNHNRTHRLSTLLPSNTAHLATPGLPPIPPAARRSSSDLPSLGAFSISSWSTINTNPTYQRVATRRAQAAMSSSEGLMRSAARVLERVNEEGGGSGAGVGSSGSETPASADGGSSSESSRFRPLEDPYLVGEEAAARARRERLARENGDDVLYKEDRRWDWFLSQVRDWDESERSWKQFRRTMETASGGVSRGRLARRLVAGSR